MWRRELYQLRLHSVAQTPHTSATAYSCHKIGIGTFYAKWRWSWFNSHYVKISKSPALSPQEPIHRGAMLETYHDGTQEVVGTTFIDDCQWDRLSEYSVSTGSGIAFDTTKRNDELHRNWGRKLSKRGLSFGDFYFRGTFDKPTTDSFPAVIFGASEVNFWFNWDEVSAFTIHR